jgi:hypothetical protein
MTLYTDSRYPVRADLDAIHEKQLDQLADPGTWGTGAQRLAIASEARQACCDAGTQEEPEDTGPRSDVELPDAVRAMVRKLAVTPKDYLEDSYEEARSGGLSDEEYVEVVGIVSRVTDMDVFARGIGVPLRPLPAAREGQPSRARPQVAKKELAWVPTVPNLPEGGEEAAEIYGDEYRPYILRSLSLVPDEMHRHIELEEIQYLPMKNILVKDYQHHEGFTRAQVELIAGRVSALNECFY